MLSVVTPLRTVISANLMKATFWTNAGAILLSRCKIALPKGYLLVMALDEVPAISPPACALVMVYLARASLMACLIIVSITHQPFYNGLMWTVLFHFLPCLYVRGASS